MISKVLLEAVFVGIIFLIISIPIMKFVHTKYPINYSNCTKKPINTKGKYYAATFMAGSLVHILCEVLGINKWYCKNGNACN
jgi:hypothetical protein